MALAVALVILACVVDYVVDRFDNDAGFVRLALWVAMLGVMLVAMIFFFQPLTARLDDDELTLWVEDKTPVLGHRLITAVQLNREHAHCRHVARTGRRGDRRGRAAGAAVAVHRCGRSCPAQRTALVAGPALLVGLGALLAFSAR